MSCMPCQGFDSRFFTASVDTFRDWEVVCAGRGLDPSKRLIIKAKWTSRDESWHEHLTSPPAESVACLEKSEHAADLV